jgi:hypothetical protein
VSFGPTEIDAIVRWAGEQIGWLGTQSNSLTSLAALIGIAVALATGVQRMIRPVGTAIYVALAIPVLILGALLDLATRPFRGSRW